MNQEKIMKAKMITAIVICIAALAGLFVFIGLYMDKSEEVRKTYIAKYMENLSAASEEIDTYLESGKNLPTRYNMIISDMGAARSLVFLIDDYTEDIIAEAGRGSEYEFDREFLKEFILNGIERLRQI